MSDAAENFAKKTPPADFPVWQSHLIAKTGLNVKEFRRLRDEHCTQDVDWRVGKLNHISFTSDAADRMFRLAMLEKNAPAEALLQPVRRTPDVPSTTPAPRPQLTQGGPVLAQADVALTVEKVWPNNHGRLQARVLMEGRHKKGELVVVRVRDNQRFRAGMGITGRFVEGNVYQVSGRVR